MQRKLKGVADPDQEPLGGRLREQSPLERVAKGTAEAPAAAGGASGLLEAAGGGIAPQAGQPGAAADGGGGGGGGGGMFGGGGGGGGDGGGAAPRRQRARGRLVRSVVFEDGSRCECVPLCEQAGTCCDDWKELCETDPTDAPGEDAASPPCPVPAEPPLASGRRDGTPVTLSFLNHARFPVKLFHAAEDGQQTEMGTLPAHGHALTFETRDTHGWAAKSFSGITLLELAPGTARTSQTVDVHECDLSSANRRLHHGWR
jgi:hypothetical protein